MESSDIVENYKEERLNICKTCDQYNSFGMCKMCGCIMVVTVRFPHYKCPLNKWGKK